MLEEWAQLSTNSAKIAEFENQLGGASSNFSDWTILVPRSETSLSIKPATQLNTVFVDGYIIVKQK